MVLELSSINLFSRASGKRLLQKFLTAQKTDDVEKAVEKAAISFVEETLEALYGRLGTIETTYPYNTDGLVRFTPTESTLFTEELAKKFSILVEAKKYLRFSSLGGTQRERQLEDRGKVLSQVIYYYHRIMEGEGLAALPAVTVVADSDELFIVPGKFLKPYLLEDHDWSISPSAAAEKNPVLLEALKNDANVGSLYIYHLEPGFDFNLAAERLLSAISNTEFSKIVVSSSNLEKGFMEFNKRVFGGSTVNTRLQASLFIQSLLGSDEVYIHPNKPRVLIYPEKNKAGETVYKELAPSKELPLFLGAYQEFFQQYDRASYTVGEQKEITEISDTLIDDFDRRFKGDFYTPSIWVHEAHKLIENALNSYAVDENGGEVLDALGNRILEAGTRDWKERYTVWDAACGTKNLTRDYRFGEGKLFLSTLHKTELAISEAYNPEATSFQYDFLNDDVEIHTLMEAGTLGAAGALEYSDSFKIPEALFNALKANAPLVFFMNPPYGQATNQDNSNKVKVADTEVAKVMRGKGLSFGSMELYTQFIKRVQMIAETFKYDNDCHFFFFNKGFLTSASFKKFTEALATDFGFEDGFMLNAGEFNGTSSSWGIIFSHWALKKPEDRTEANRQTEFPFTVKRAISSESGELRIVDLDHWIGKGATTKNVSTFIPNQKAKTALERGEYPTTANGFGVSKAKTPVGKMFADSIGYIHAGGSNIQFSDKYTGWYSLCFNSGHGYPVAPDNFEKLAVHFSVRKSALPGIAEKNQLWIRDKDVFPAPTDSFQTSSKWPKFVADCVVYSLFASGSNQTSLRNYEYGANPDGTPRLWNIVNQFFWKPSSTIRALAEERDANRSNTPNFNRAIQEDLDNFGKNERFVYKWLTDHEEDISKKAKKLLETADKILEESFKYRAEFAELHPRYNLNTWDSGWAQLYKMCYSRDALPVAKADPKLKDLKKSFDKRLRALGDKIAKEYSEDTGF